MWTGIITGPAAAVHLSEHRDDLLILSVKLGGRCLSLLRKDGVSVLSIDVTSCCSGGVSTFLKDSKIISCNKKEIFNVSHVLNPSFGSDTWKQQIHLLNLAKIEKYQSYIKIGNKGEITLM